jgi:hypothetical protein
LIAGALCSSYGCATVFRGGTRDLVVLGPEDLRIGADGHDVRAVPAGSEHGLTRYELQIPKGTETVTLESHGVKAPAKLEKHASAGWVVVDIIFGAYILPWAVDGMTGNWSNFNDVDATKPLLAAGWKKSDAPPGQAVATREVAKPAPPREVPKPAPQREAVQEPPPARKVVISSGKLAVLDFKNSARDLKTEDVRYFTDVVRGTSLKVAPGLQVMTRENLIMLLQATGKDPGQCEGECEVDTGRRIGADANISGDVLKVGSKYHISLRLHETHDGRLLSSSIASGKTIDELDEGLQAAATSLLAP